MARRQPRRVPYDPRNVFLNVPFDTNYERQFLGMIAALVAVGRTPRSVLELPEVGRGRLDRLLQHLRHCGVSVHDLCRVGTPARFNMPFELGLACALAHVERRHQYVLLERVQYRLDRTLSDLRGRDPYVHRGSVRQTIVIMLDVFQRAHQPVEPEVVFRLYNDLWRAARELKRRYHSESIFTRSLFVRVVAAATTLATEAGLLPA